MAKKLTKKDLLQTPTTQIEPSKVTTVLDLLEQYKGMSFQARNLGMCMQVWENALTDPERPTIILGVAGCLMAGGQRKVIRDMVRYGLVDVIVTTGAQPYQDMYAARGYNFWRSSPDADDLLLREFFLDRLYDTLVDEEKFRETDEYLGAVFAELDPKKSYSTREIMHHFGEHFQDVDDSWVAECYRQGVPIFVPAMNDSSIGIGMVAQWIKAREAGKPYPRIDPIRDAFELSQIKYRSKKTGVVYLAGGIPKNYIQQTEVISEIMGYDPGGHQYAVQLTTDSDYWGGLSGCSFEEAQSWGKIAKDAKKCQAHVDVTLGLPLIVTALLQKRDGWANRKRLSFEYEGEDLLAMKQVPAAREPSSAKANGAAKPRKVVRAPARK